MKDCLIEGIKKVDEESLISFHMPGHKNNKEIFKKYLKNMNLIDMDLTEIPKVDNLHNSKGIIKESQKKLSKYYGSDKSYFLVNGSTCGILSMIYATTKKNDKILINRNAHKSVINAILLNELEPIYISPEIDKKTGLIMGINSEEIEKILKENSEIKAVLLTYPTYDGICMDIEKITKIVKKYNKYLLIDEAHGSHFAISDKFPFSAMKFGADIIVQSAHKNLPAFTQGAYLHVNNKSLIKRVEKYLKIFQSSSPSYLIMSSLDMSLDFILEEGEKRACELNKNILEFNKKLEKYNYKLLNVGINYNKSIKDYDISKIIISALEIGISGKKLEKILRKDYKIQAEYSTYNYVLFISTILNQKDNFEKLLFALIDIEEKYKNSKIKSKKSLILEKVIVKYKPSEVEKFDYEEIKLNKALNKVSYETITPYPPGIPLINPGELITSEALEKIEYLKNSIKIIKEF